MAAFQAAARFWLHQDEEIIKREPPPIPVKPSRLMRKLSEGSMKKSSIQPRASSPVDSVAEAIPSSPRRKEESAEKKASPANKRVDSKRSSILPKSPFGKRKKSKSKKGSSSGSSQSGKRDRAISTPVPMSPVPRRAPSPLGAQASSGEALGATGAAAPSLSVAQQVESVPRQRHVISSPALSQRPKRAATKDALKNIVFELIDTERDYLVDLQIIEDIFYSPIEKLQLLSSADCCRLFGNVRQLLPVHKRLLERLEEAEKASPSAVNVGRCIIEEAESLKLYESYCTNQPRALELYDQLKTSNENLMSYLAIAAEKPECRGLDLNAFLIKPLQRICKYPLLVRELVKQTPLLPAAPYNDLIVAEEKVKSIVSYINESKREKEMFGQMIDLQRKIQSATGRHIGIMDADRRLLQTGEAVVITKQFKKVATLYALFNNLLVLTKPSYKLYAYVPLGEALVNHVSIHDVSHSLEVVHAGNKKLWMSFPTEQECMALFDRLTELVEILLEEQMSWYNEPRTATPKDLKAEVPADRRLTMSGAEAFDSFSSKPLPKPPSMVKQANGAKPATPPKPRRFSMPVPRAGTPPPPSPALPSSLSKEQNSSNGNISASAPPIPARPGQVLRVISPLRSPTPDNPKPTLRPEDRQSYRALVRSAVAKAAAAEDSVEISCRHQGREFSVLLPKTRQTYSLFRQRMCRQLKTFAFKARTPGGAYVCDQSSLDDFLTQGNLVLECEG